MDTEAILPEAIIRRLLTKVHAQAGSIIAELTQGKDWEKSVYHFLFYETPEEQDAFFALMEISWKAFYERIGKPVQQAVPASVRKVIRSLVDQSFPNPPRPEVELMTLTCYCLNHLKYSGKFYALADPSQHYTLSAARIERVNAAILRKAIPPYKGKLVDILDAKEPMLSEVDLDSIMRALFNALLEISFDWHYFDSWLANLTSFYQIQQYRPEKLDDIIDESGFAISPEFYQNGELFLAKEFKEAQQEMPPREVLAYFDVYKRWPRGYPPEIEDYLL